MKRKRPRFYISIAALSALVVIFSGSYSLAFGKATIAETQIPWKNLCFSVTNENQTYITSMLLWKVADVPI